MHLNGTTAFSPAARQGCDEVGYCLALHTAGWAQHVVPNLKCDRDKLKPLAGRQAWVTGESHVLAGCTAEQSCAVRLAELW